MPRARKQYSPEEVAAAQVIIAGIRKRKKPVAKKDGAKKRRRRGNGGGGGGDDEEKEKEEEEGEVEDGGGGGSGDEGDGPEGGKPPRGGRAKGAAGYRRLEPPWFSKQQLKEFAGGEAPPDWFREDQLLLEKISAVLGGEAGDDYVVRQAPRLPVCAKRAYVPPYLTAVA